MILVVAYLCIVTFLVAKVVDHEALFQNQKQQLADLHVESLALEINTIYAKLQSSAESEEEDAEDAKLMLDEIKNTMSSMQVVSSAGVSGVLSEIVKKETLYKDTHEDAEVYDYRRSNFDCETASSHALKQIEKRYNENTGAGVGAAAIHVTYELILRLVLVSQKARGHGCTEQEAGSCDVRWRETLSEKCNCIVQPVLEYIWAGAELAETNGLGFGGLNFDYRETGAMMCRNASAPVTVAFVKNETSSDEFIKQSSSSFKNITTLIPDPNTSIQNPKSDLTPEAPKTFVKNVTTDPITPIEEPKSDPVAPIEEPKSDIAPEPLETFVKNVTTDPVTSIEKPKSDPVTPIKEPKSDSVTPIEEPKSDLVPESSETTLTPENTLNSEEPELEGDPDDLIESDYGYYN